MHLSGSYIKWLLVIFLGFVSLKTSGQSNSTVNCNGQLKGFISDGQEYLIKTKDISKFDIIFYPGFIYRLELCTEHKDISLEFKLVDEKGNVQYSSKISKGFMRDFRFDTLFHGQIILKPIGGNNQPAQILLGYKKIE